MKSMEGLPDGSRIRLCHYDFGPDQQGGGAWHMARPVLNRGFLLTTTFDLSFCTTSCYFSAKHRHNMYTSEILAAPRPVRLSAFSHHASPVAFRITSPTLTERKSASPTDNQDDGRLSPLRSDISNRSPRLSPRLVSSEVSPDKLYSTSCCRPNSEALEEFLSILRPAIPALFAPLPQSPVARARRFLQNSFSERQHSFHDRSLSLTTSADNIVRDGIRTPSRSPSVRTPSSVSDENDELAPLRLMSAGPQGEITSAHVGPITGRPAALELRIAEPDC